MWWISVENLERKNHERLSHLDIAAIFVVGQFQCHPEILFTEKKSDS